MASICTVRARRYDWHARAGDRFAVQDFAIDWEEQLAVCPVGKTSISWTPAFDNRGLSVIKVKFSPKDCRKCSYHPQCTALHVVG